MSDAERLAAWERWLLEHDAHELLGVPPGLPLDRTEEGAIFSAGFDAGRASANAELRDAVTNLIERLVGLVESGDCGYWNPEDEPAIRWGRAALAAMDSPTPPQAAADPTRSAS